MKDGLDQAKLNKDIININDLSVDKQSTVVANAQLTEFNQTEPRSNDALTSSELALLIATEQDQDQSSTCINISQDPETIEDVLLCTETSQQDPGGQDLPLQQKISTRLQFSNYLVCPIRLSYRKMYDTTSLTLFASFRWLSQKQSKTETGSRRQRLCASLAQEPPASHHLNFAQGKV